MKIYSIILLKINDLNKNTLCSNTPSETGQK